MKKSDVVQSILGKQFANKPVKEKGLSFAPTNIALCKYWGKRDTELNLPVTSSLSIALPDKGAMTTLTLTDQAQDQIFLNDQIIDPASTFFQRIEEFLNLFRPDKNWYLQIDIKADVPIAAGLASSACGFASLVAAMNELFDWKLPQTKLSILARLGSGSAARSFWNGFVEWHAGIQSDGMDSFAEPLTEEWPDLCLGILSISEAAKPISSREAMQATMNSSVMYNQWPKKANHDLAILKQAIKIKNFSLLGGTAEANALTMHAMMLSTWPPICYFLPETIAAMQKIWASRKEGLELYFTQDAGPNLKLLFQEKDQSNVISLFPEVEVVNTFEP